MKPSLRIIPLKPLTMSVLKEQTRELAVSKDAETAAQPIYSPRLAEIDLIAKGVDPRHRL